MGFLANEAKWPTALPAPLSSGYSIERLDSSVNMEMDSGHTRRRAIYTYAPSKVSLSWRFNQSQFDAFDSFWENDLAGGAKPFAIQLHGFGSGLNWVHGEFMDMYQATVIEPGQFQVSAAILVMRSAWYLNANPLVESAGAKTDKTANPYNGVSSFSITP